MHTDKMTLLSKVKKLGYKLTESDGAYTLTPIKRGMILHFANRKELIAWLQSELVTASSNYYLGEFGK